MKEEFPEGPTSKEHLEVILKPKNLLRTLAGQIPLASAGAEILGQLDDHATDVRIGNLEKKLDEVAALKKLEDQQPAAKISMAEWPPAVTEYLSRTVNFCVAYDGGHEHPSKKGRELYKVVGHGCVIDENLVVTCQETVEFMRGLADLHNGRTVIAVGLVWYDFELTATDDLSGLATIRISGPDRTYQERKEMVESRDLGIELDTIATTAVRGSTMPWLGQEIGFLYRGEADDISASGDPAGRQFDTSVISHFRKMRKGCLKSFVTGVLPSSFQFAGSPVFARDGTLLGLISEAINYTNDAGRRAVVRSLLGHPRFTEFKK